MDIGSPLLFESRLGFSGTPSNLLLKHANCRFEPGSRESGGLPYDPSIVDHPEVLLAQDKTKVCCKGWNREFHALIDCGALVVGMTNREVADHLMHQLPTSGFDAVVYIDAAGKKRQYSEETM